MALRRIRDENTLNFVALALVFITLSMPKYNLNSQAIITLILVWFIKGNFKKKIETLKVNKYVFLSISIWFFLFLLGLIYTGNFGLGIKNIQKNIPLLVIPIVIFSTEWNWQRLKFLLNWFSISVICCALFALAKASYFTYMNFGNYFYNQNLASLLNTHTTYFALFCVLVILYYSYEVLFKTPKYFYFIAILFLIIFLYLLSSRMGVFALGLGVFVQLFRKYSFKSLFAIIPITSIIIVFLFSPNFQKREIGYAEFGTVTPNISTRILHWQAVLDAVKSNNVFVGASSGTDKNHLYNAYEEVGFQEGLKHKFNAHNQFLEYFVYFGLVTLLAWAFCFWIWIRKLSKNQHPFLLSAFTVIICFMFTESILERQRGIVVFALFISMVLSIKTKRNELHK